MPIGAPRTADFLRGVQKKIVKDLVSKRTRIGTVVAEHQVNRNSVYNWLYKYSPQHEPKPTLVVQMQSEETKSRELRQRVAQLERIIGQKQLEIDFLNKLMEVGSRELGFDLKKNFSPPPSNGSAATGKSTLGG